MDVRQLTRFPNPVNDHAARVVGAGVVLMASVALLADLPWMLVPLTYGFAARVLAGPRLSPLGQLATRVVAPAIAKAPKLVPGPPKRFAQAIGLGFTAAASIVTLTAGWAVGRFVLLPLIFAAFLEAAFGICLGCISFAWLMRRGVIPEEICEACNDLSLRPKASA